MASIDSNLDEDRPANRNPDVKRAHGSSLFADGCAKRARRDRARLYTKLRGELPGDFSMLRSFKDWRQVKTRPVTPPNEGEGRTTRPGSPITPGRTVDLYPRCSLRCVVGLRASPWRRWSASMPGEARWHCYYDFPCGRRAGDAMRASGLYMDSHIPRRPTGGAGDRTRRVLRRYRQSELIQVTRPARRLD